MSQRQQYAIVPREALCIPRYRIPFGCEIDDPIDDPEGGWVKASDLDAALAAPPPPDQVLTDEEINEFARAIFFAADRDDRQSLVRQVERAVLTRLTEPK